MGSSKLRPESTQLFLDQRFLTEVSRAKISRNLFGGWVESNETWVGSK